MPDGRLEGWIRDREPPIPPALLAHLTGIRGGRSDADGLCALGIDALTRALDRPGGDREAAFHLLAADAFFTYGCEAAASEPDTRATLEALVRRIGDHFSP